MILRSVPSAMFNLQDGRLVRSARQVEEDQELESAINAPKYVMASIRDLNRERLRKYVRRAQRLDDFNCEDGIMKLVSI